MASAAANIVEIDIDGGDYTSGETIQLDKGEEYTLKVYLENPDLHLKINETCLSISFYYLS